MIESCDKVRTRARLGKYYQYAGSGTLEEIWVVLAVRRRAMLNALSVIAHEMYCPGIPRYLIMITHHTSPADT